jgi:siroheme synthase
MGKAAARTVAARLMAAGLVGRTPVAIVENASLCDERVLLTRLDLLGLSAEAASGNGPVLILIGDAVGLSRAGGAKPETEFADDDWRGQPLES